MIIRKIEKPCFLKFGSEIFLLFTLTILHQKDYVFLNMFQKNHQTKFILIEIDIHFH